MPSTCDSNSAGILVGELQSLDALMPPAISTESFDNQDQASDQVKAN